MNPVRTLQSEIRDLCAEFAYPTGWPRHRVCPCCESASIRYLFQKWDMTHDICKNCQLVFMNPYPTDEFLGRLYNAGYISNAREMIEIPKARAGRIDALNAMRPEHYDEIMDVVAQHHTSGRWLDVAGGIGHFLDRVRKRFTGFETYLNEMSQVSADFAREFYKHRVLTHSLEQIVRMNERFDVITIIAALEHMPHPRPVVAQLVELLAPGGVLVINVPNFTRLNRWLSHGDSGAVTAPYHLSLFNCKNLPRLLEAHPGIRHVRTWESGPQSFYWAHLARIVDNNEVVIPTEPSERCTTVNVYEYTPRQFKQINRMAFLDRQKWLRHLIERFDGLAYLNVAVQKTGGASLSSATPAAKAA